MATCKECLHSDCYDQSLEDAETCNFFLHKEDYQLVVRCKDCKHKMVYPIRPSATFCEVWAAFMGDEGYCNYGERKDNER